MEKSCETCKHMLENGCGKICDSEYSGWEAKTAPEPLKTCAACEKILTGCISKSGFCVYPDRFAIRHTAAEQDEAPLSGTQKRITEICDEIKNILLEKNRKYGDSAINPKRVFSKASPTEQINVRLDDKLSRIMSAQDDDTEDAELDLIGYLILKRVAKSVWEGR